MVMYEALEREMALKQVGSELFHCLVQVLADQGRAAQHLKELARVASRSAIQLELETMQAAAAAAGVDAGDVAAEMAADRALKADCPVCSAPMIDGACWYCETHPAGEPLDGREADDGRE